MPAAILLDQRRSRRGPDLVEPWLKRVNSSATTLLLPFERTVGDEMEGLVDDPRTLTSVVLQALQSPSWWIGIGIGPVDWPLPHSVRQSRGLAFELARQAIEEAKARPERLRVLASNRDPGDLEAGLQLMGALYSRRRQRDSPVLRLRSSGLNTVQIAERLGITKQAVSQQLLTARWPAEQAGRRLVEHLAAAAMA